MDVISEILDMIVDIVELIVSVIADRKKKKGNGRSKKDNV